MATRTQAVAVGLELGKKRVFAAALEWPGWGRAGKDEAGAVEALANYAERYATVLKASRIGTPTNPAPEVAERVPGNATTDFGAPDAAFAADEQPFDPKAAERLADILDASWDAFLAAWTTAADRPLKKGPRGGGRDAPSILGHVVEAHPGYLRRLGLKPETPGMDDPPAVVRWAKTAGRDGLAEAAAGSLPDVGPRGGTIWKPRRFARRAAWHILDHAWEIEDRLQ